MLPARLSAHALSAVMPARHYGTAALDRHVRYSWPGTTTTFSDGRSAAAKSAVETFVETPIACTLCILGIPGTAVISLCRQIA
jgi:hypothetical protein